MNDFPNQGFATVSSKTRGGGAIALPVSTALPELHTGTSYQNFFHSTIIHPGRYLGCPEKGTSSRNYNLFVWFDVFSAKWNDIQKSYKNYQNPLKSYCFLGYFQSLFNFGWKTAAQTN